MNVIHHYKLKHIDKPLPKGLSFIDPITGNQYSTNDISLLELTARINQDRGSSNSPLPQLELPLATELITASLVEQKLPQTILDTYFTPAIALPSSQQTLSFTRAMVYDLYKRGYVPLLTRQKRAQKCLKCPFHVTRTAKFAMPSPITAFVNKAINYFSDISQSYPEEEALGSCNVCGCPMKAKVKFSKQAVLAETTPEQIEVIFKTLGSNAPSKCWIVEENVVEPTFIAKAKNSEFPQAAMLMQEWVKGKALEAATAASTAASTPTASTIVVTQPTQPTKPAPERKPAIAPLDVGVTKPLPPVEDMASLPDLPMPPKKRGRKKKPAASEISDKTPEKGAFE